jgi:uncharacterized protein YndB with AHSA1/START domain
VTDHFGNVDADEIGQTVPNEHLVFEMKQSHPGHTRTLPSLDLLMAMIDRARNQLTHRTSGFLRPAGRK